MSIVVKDEVISLIKELPDSSTLDDIMEQLYVKQKIITKNYKRSESIRKRTILYS